MGRTSLEINKILDDGSVVSNTPQTINFIGAGVTATSDSLGNIDVTIPGAAGGGDVTGPAGATADNIATYNGATGKIIKDGGAKVSDLATTTIVAGKKAFHGVVARPVGATNPLPTTINSTTFTLGATANNISYYYNGTLVNVTADKTATLDDGLGGSTAGLYFVYFNGTTGNILATKTFPGIDTSSNVLLCTVNWNGTNLGLINDERHGYRRCTDWHTWAHTTIGARYRSGITLTHNSGTGAAATFATTAGEIADEDIQFSVPASSAFPTANAGRLWYQTGATTYAFVAATATTPGYLGANNRPNYVNTTGYALTQMTSATNRYINVFVYATTDLHTPIYFFTETVSAAVAGTNGHTSLANARAVPFPSLAGQIGISAELKPIYRLIWRADGVLQAIDTAQDDYRTVSSLPMAAGNTSTTASAVTFNPAGNIAATTVQTAIEELDTDTNSTFITGVTLSSASWSLVSGLYEYTYSNALILSTSNVTVVPDNINIAIVQAAVMLPYVTVAAGSIKMYATSAPTGNISVNVIIQK